MAAFAAAGLNVIRELSLVHIVMAALTAQVRKVENPAFASGAAIGNKVADNTRHR